jgi:hypothetical protein
VIVLDTCISNLLSAINQEFGCRIVFSSICWFGIIYASQVVPRRAVLGNLAEEINSLTPVFFILFFFSKILPGVLRMMPLVIETARDEG